MTTLFRPVLISSAEQAEALPEGTIASRVLKFESTWDTVTQPEAAVKIGINAWYSTAVDADAWDWLDRHLVGWMALVPIEAEERIGSEMCHQITDKRYDIHVLPAGDEKQARWQIENNPDYATGRIMRQYRTPWEEA